MDAGIAETLIRTDVAKLLTGLDRMNPGWFLENLLDSPLGGADITTDPYAQASLSMAFRIVAARTGDTFHFDGNPADNDWETMRREIHSQIERRRTPYLARIM